ncbi:MAG: NPCBM/NEW2 domain-containing protein, partial [Planctomycetaceae bacterium]|nr:NPCBM/NEW2 domain-containing protein [Planctomycetaceae bacterium]
MITRFAIFTACILASLPALAVEPMEVWKYLHTDDAVSVKQEWKPTQNDVNIGGEQIRIAGQKFRKGLGTHAPGEIIFNLDGKHKTFRTFVGVDDNGGETGSVVFQIFLDGKKVADTGLVKTGDKAKEIRLDVSGVKELKLVCTDGGNGVQGDWAVWADASVDDRETLTPKPVPQFSTAGFYAVEGSPRKVWSFNPGWRFYKGNIDGAEKPDFDDSDWEAANLPHGMEILGFNQSGGRNYQGPAWYRKSFEIPAESKGKRFVLYFEAVMGKAKVFLDGKLVKEHIGGYLPFAVDLTDQLTNGGKHLVAVLADNSDDPSYPPGKPQGNLDFTYLGGIYRDVFLIETSHTYVTLPELSSKPAGIFVGIKEAHDDRAKIEFRTYCSVEEPCIVRTIVEDAEGKQIYLHQYSAPSNEGLYKNEVGLEKLRLWHPDDPYLYWIKTEILDKDRKVLDSLRTRVGFRLFEMRGHDGFFINGKPIGHPLSGVNRHQDYSVVGNALPNSGQWRDAQLLREGGCTIVRAAHYPLDPAFMDASDELGLFVTVAVPGWQFYNDKNPDFWKGCVADTRAMARRDRNHPAVLLWETSLNETDVLPVEMLKEMHAALHEEIPFPGVFSVGDSDHGRRAGFDVYYYANGDEPICSFTREYGDGGEVENFMSQNASTRVKREWGEAALLKQAMIRARDLPGIYGSSPKQIGATLWCGIDHERGYHPDSFWGGLLDGLRNPKYSYHVFKSQYDADFKLPGIETGPMIFIAHELTQISPSDVLILTNCEEVRLTWLGKEIGTQKPAEDYNKMPHPPVIFKDVFDFRVI